jgi:hypothetical protein
MTFQRITERAHYCHRFVRDFVEVSNFDERIFAMSYGIPSLRKKLHQPGLVGESWGWHRLICERTEFSHSWHSRGCVIGLSDNCRYLPTRTSHSNGRKGKGTIAVPFCQIYFRPFDGG